MPVRCVSCQIDDPELLALAGRPRLQLSLNECKMTGVGQLDATFGMIRMRGEVALAPKDGALGSLWFLAATAHRFGSKGGSVLIHNGLTHHPQARETFRFFRGDLSLPSRIILLDGSGTISLTFSRGSPSRACR